MFGVSLSTLKQALGMANEATKANEESSSSKLTMKSSGKSKKLSSKSLSAVVSLTQKVGGNERV
jgi:hypothetical protein